MDIIFIGAIIGLVRDYRRPDRRLRKAEEAVMSWVYLLTAGVSVAIFVYLVVALLYPEKF